ncbi:MAG: type II secretion system protein [Leifsonia sp.]
MADTPGRGHDDGYTLFELIVAMGIFSVFLSILVASVVSITHASTSVQAVSGSTNGALIAFQALDREIRYADAINFPGTGTDGGRYVEFRTPAEDTVGRQTICTQWIYDPVAQLIKQRSWVDASGAKIPAWHTELSNVVNQGTGTYPFQMLPASVGGSPVQQLVITLQAGAPPLKASTTVVTNFAARNSSISSPSNTDVLMPNVSDSPVCLSSGTRTP